MVEGISIPALEQIKSTKTRGKATQVYCILEGVASVEGRV